MGLDKALGVNVDEISWDPLKTNNIKNYYIGLLKN
jgi:hypothetical protein